ncbi:ABC transporter substrate-binding protein [Roseateles amylovorans]|uniref:NrtA/SsuA/CpmA family ABC transporter substrate-binding protein n=1 Tax=Roseateles amylovorans TaxID=2978473 RepID=A0ABY6AVS7_9BURK|nr:NrtA/SsuA/CpmA family ABC transporter substrate-binding protein [Roseateles amylovorans]UXH76494.1 NrtA/SsuA/CpmA family ABC transporter substrate-binding protein [Roseateles amylovorans]
MLAAWFGLSRRSAAPPPVTEQLSIALPQAPHAGLIHLADAKGLFQAYGLSVTVLPQIHGKAALAEVLRGGADLAASADVPLVIEVLKDAPLSIVTTVATASNELAVLARRDRAINSPADLQQRRVGVTLGTSGEYFLWAFMVRHRLAPQSLVLVDLPPGRLVAALRDGSVDAIAAWQPVRHEAEQALSSVIASFTAPDAYAQKYAVVGRSDFLTSRGEALRRLMRALLEAEHFAETEPLEAKRLLASRLKLSPDALEPAWQALDLGVDQQQDQLITLEDVATWAMARGYVPAQPMPNFLAHLNLDALQAVRPGRVTVVR